MEGWLKNTAIKIIFVVLRCLCLTVLVFGFCLVHGFLFSVFLLEDDFTPFDVVKVKKYRGSRFQEEDCTEILINWRVIRFRDCGKVLGANNFFEFPDRQHDGLSLAANVLIPSRETSFTVFLILILKTSLSRLFRVCDEE
jgi:hypothetical protein